MKAIKLPLSLLHRVFMRNYFSLSYRGYGMVSRWFSDDAYYTACNVVSWAVWLLLWAVCVALLLGAVRAFLWACYAVGMTM